MHAIALIRRLLADGDNERMKKEIASLKRQLSDNERMKREIQFLKQQLHQERNVNAQLNVRLAAQVQPSSSSIEQSTAI